MGAYRGTGSYDLMSMAFLGIDGRAGGSGFTVHVFPGWLHLFSCMLRQKQKEQFVRVS